MIQKPYSINISGQTIDATEDNIISWSISGGIQYAKSILIKNNSTDATVFTLAKTTSFAKNYTLPLDTLTNGIEYKVIIQVCDESDNTATSDAVIFATSSRPVAGVTTPTVTAPTYTFAFTYSQAESIALRSWIAYVYDSTQTLIDNSGIQTTSTLEYLFEGFQSDEDYYIEFQATSNDGLVGTSGLILFSVSYAQPNLQSTLTIENVSNAGVKITWDALQIIGDGTNYSFSGGEKVDTTATGGEIHFDSGYTIESDFSMRLLIESVPNANFNIVTNTLIIACATTPSNTDALWVVDSAQITEQVLTFVATPSQPVVSNILWLEDTSLVSEKVLTVNLDIIKPGSTNITWIDLGANLDNLTFNIIHEDNYTIYLRRYNNTFYLYKDDVIVDSLALTATNYCLVIKRISDVWTIEGGDVTP